MQKKTSNNKKKAAVILEQLNEWMDAVYNKDTNELASTGEAQARIRDYLLQLDRLKVTYVLKNGRYMLL
ncbi:hypothetical protein A8C56_04870 [Niabella ginsenosidivorans]|uniref:Uncharacterized protein n=1 Tax=Niabella ginsenosidivorans TaxID=1176587 RepID=A0A1A9HZ95_9BACT|nr:hypothetical protein [Niabella ginsenosidivorans]ANH80405.1 hypothetical protein A8C56_04870 [Niabella ginsenosidivorans]